MSYGRLNLRQENDLWALALNHFGPAGLEQVVQEIWSQAKAPARPLVEALNISSLGAVVFRIVQTVQTRVGASVPYRPSGPTQILLYSSHACDLTIGLLDKMPPKALPRDLRGFKLPIDFGL